MNNYLERLAINLGYFFESSSKRPAWLSEKSGIKPPNLSKILGRVGNPTLSTIEALADAIGISPSDLLAYYPSSTFFEKMLLERQLSAIEKKISAYSKEYGDAIQPLSAISKEDFFELESKYKIAEADYVRIKSRLAHVREMADYELGWKKTEMDELISKIDTILPTLNEEQLRFLLKQARVFSAMDTTDSNATKNNPKLKNQG